MSSLLFKSMLALLGFTTLLHSQEESQDLDQLIRDLSGITRQHASSELGKLSDTFRRRIELADQILQHPDLEESQRAITELNKLQAFGLLYAIDQREKKNDADLLKQYQAQIENLIDDENERVSLEAVSANANLSTNLYIRNPGKDSASATAAALDKLVAIAPKDPIIQTTKRLLMERVWNSDQPSTLFEVLDAKKDKAAAIVLPSLKKESSRESSREKAEFKWAKHFSRFNDFVAMNRLAEMYENGKGTRANNTQAARWYEKLARLGDLRSTTKLGDFYLAGKGYSSNPETAVEFYQKAATAGYRVAQFKLAECYRLGSGLDQSDENWKKWVKSSAFNATSAEVQELYESVDFKTSADSFQIFYQVLVEQNPDDIYYLNNLAFSLLVGKNKQPERSLELIDKAIASAPDNFEGIANFQDTRAHALKHLGKFKEAAEIFESVLDKLDDKKSIIEALIECYQEFDPEKAKSYRTKLSELPDDKN